nr:MAG TPA: hypothetical protein [Crassvirales sp.]
MNLDAIISISIDEESLVKALIKEREGDSFEGIMNWIVTEDGESWLLKWINNHADKSVWDELDDYSYQELLDYIEDKLEDCIES